MAQGSVFPDTWRRSTGRQPIVALLFFAAATIGAPALAQESSSVTDSILINPGARSIALGGAFAAIADDATAALANPSGLVQILRPEISAEFRGTAITTRTGEAFEQEASLSGLGFFSFVYPGRSWAVAIYSHQLAGLDFTFLGSDPFTRELKVQSYSASFALQISEGLSIGAGASYYKADLGAFGPSAGPSDSGRGFNAGLLWNPSTNWKLAGFYRQGPEFEATVGPEVPVELSSSTSLLVFPDVYGAAVSFQPGNGGLTLGMEIDRVSRTVEGLAPAVMITDGGTELHLGVEYAILKWRPVVAFRAGVWREPGGERRSVENGDAVSVISSDSANHASLGFGFAFSRFQIDFGADISNHAVVGSLSMVISF